MEQGSSVHGQGGDSSRAGTTAGSVPFPHSLPFHSPEMPSQASRRQRPEDQRLQNSSRGSVLTRDPGESTLPAADKHGSAIWVLFLGQCWLSAEAMWSMVLRSLESGIHGKGITVSQ